jgi:dipeptidyl aminopeptidase/acylaminoacyl peptidase
MRRSISKWVSGRGVDWARHAAIAGIALIAAGCSFKGSPTSEWPQIEGLAQAKAQANPSAPLAQGEDAAANSAAQLPGAADAPGAPAPSVEAMVYPASMIEPLKAPAINVFGELDGHPPRTNAARSDFGFQQHTYTDEGYDGDVHTDPSGKWIVFSSTRHHVKPELYLQRVDGTSVTQLTSDPAEDVQPVFSPDGRHIAFASTRAGSWDIYTMDLDGKNVTQVTSGPGQDMHPTFSPDGTRLAYCSIGGRSNQWELWVVNLTTRERKMVGYGLFPSWSPDKNVDRIAFQRARQRGSRWFSLWTLDLVDGEARRITEVAVSSNAAIVTPVWAPDGKRLAFTTIVDPAQMNKGKLRGQQDIWVIDADGGNRHRVTDGTGTNLSPSWAADNRVYFISDRGGQENIWSVRAEARVNSWPVAGKKTPEGGVGSTDAGDPSK